VFRLIDFGLAEKEKPKLECNRHARAHRGGSRGFRAPEVLLQVVHQTTAIDIWSAGIILLSMLCCRFPVLSPADDSIALLEISAGETHPFTKNGTFEC
jgi:cell division control protein 7